MPLSAGDKLGPYEILASIGAGGMGEVYRARDTKLERDVAAKVLPAALAEDPERLARFEREAKVLASLNHPNIASIYGVEERALIMEFVEGDSPQGPMSFDDAWKICSQIADGLEYAHEKRVVHRDLKPANVKVTPEGRVKILDFGLAKAFTGEPHKPASAGPDSPTLTMGSTQAGMILGSPAYMAPEQVRGKEADSRADIWAFGVVLYELLTGERLFKGSDAPETMLRVLNDAPTFGKAPANARRLLASCLEKDPEKRLRSVGDASRILEQPAPSQSRFGVGAAVAAGVMAVALIAISWIAWRATRPVEQPLTRFSVDLGPNAVAGPRTTAAISPDGRRLVFVVRGEGGKEQLATRLLEQTNYILLPDTDNAVDPFFSPDSQWIGFFADNKMKKVSVQGGGATTLTDAPAGRGASWGEDGNIIFTPNLSAGVGLSSVPAAGGVAKVLTKPENGEVSHRWPQILPGGEDVLFSTSNQVGAFDDGGIDVLSLKTGKWKTVQQGGYYGRYLPTGHLVYLHQGTLYARPFDLDRLEVRGVPVPVLDDVAGDPAFAAGQFEFSRTGAFVYLSGRAVGQRPIAWMDSAGKTHALVAAPGNYFTPRFSPDGKRLVFDVALNTLQVYDLQRDTTTQLATRDPAITPVWAPDGTHIAYATLKADGSQSIEWIRSDGAREPYRLLESKYQIRLYSFSPDGKRLAYTDDNVETGVDIWTLPLDLSDPEHPKPGKPERFLKSPGIRLEPAISPDGRWIAYRSQESGVPGIRVRPFPGPGGQWLVSTAQGVHPFWSRNGRELFFEGPNDQRISVVTYTTKGDTFIPDKPQLWSDAQIQEPNMTYWNLDLAPDGKRFAVFPRPDAAADRKSSVHVTVLLNFFDELRRRVPLSGK